MGFGNGKYATVWQVKPYSDRMTKAKFTCSIKDKNTGEFKKTFAGYGIFAGVAAASKAAGLKEGERIRLKDIDVTSNDNEKYPYNFVVYDFEVVESYKSPTPSNDPEPPAGLDDGEVEEPDLPF